MKLVRVTLLAIAASLLLAACGKPIIERDAQYQMGDFAVTENAEFGVSATEVILEEGDDGVEQVVVDIMIVNNSLDIFNVSDLDIDYYTPTGEELEYTSVKDPGENYMLPGGNTLATLFLKYTEDGTYYLNFLDATDKETLYAIEVKKGEVIEKALPEVTNTASADLGSNVEKGVASGLGNLEFTFGTTNIYTLTSFGSDQLYYGVELTIRNTGSDAVNFDGYSFYQIYTYQDNTVSFSSVMNQIGSDDDDVLEIGEVTTLEAGESKAVTLMVSSSPSAGKDLFARYIEITFDGEKITYKF
ncbi:hypothetical protein [Culicoidibacter larvae]|uniref:DUF4352 domain-containing protein n=1 Tax=Culicoidibacter larvae TaxID=2579976 RepID=A0A5R8Q7Y4_9FIRM|nr:hypothetical protein [Culicoidibacter larvae]TLG71215.1 hypothetical protein FEZ08_11210 [Culicoidibacter larvae]